MTKNRRPVPITHDVETIAPIVAEIVSGVKGALPEQFDFDVAKKILQLVENEIQAAN